MIVTLQELQSDRHPASRCDQQWPTSNHQITMCDHFGHGRLFMLRLLEFFWDLFLLRGRISNLLYASPFLSTTFDLCRTKSLIHGRFS